MTSESKTPPLWPFLVVDAVFILLAVFIFQQAHRPMLWWEAVCLSLCAAAGAWSFITPFLRRSANTQALAQADKLVDFAEKFQKLDQLSSQISHSTAQWQIIQDTASKTATTAADLARNMADEAKAFTDFLQRANDIERSHLRLEVEKLRRSESEWLQVFIRTLDHVFALFQAAQQSGQPALLEQITSFQNACRDNARRVGLAAYFAQDNDSFDPKRHQPANNPPIPENALILEMLVPGYTCQGQVVRRALVRLKETPSS